MTASSNDIQVILSDYEHSKNSHDLAIFCCNQLIDSFKDYEQIKNQSNIFIVDYFDKIRDLIEHDRNQKISDVNRIYNELFNELNCLKNECLLSKPLSDDNLEMEMNMLKQMLNEWIQELSDSNLEETRCKIINSEGKKLEAELKCKLGELKSKCLLNRSIKYEPREAELNFKGTIIVKTISMANIIS